MRTAFSNNCPVQKQDNMQNLTEEGLAFLQGKNAQKHQIIYATTTQPAQFMHRKRICNAQIICGILLASILATGLIALEIYRSTEIMKLREDTNKLRADFENLKHRLLEDDLLEEIRAFEQQSYNEDEAARTATTSKPPQSDDDDADDDYGVDEDDDDVYDYSEDDAAADQGTRQKRDIELQPPVVARKPTVLGRTEDGVPVLSHSYAAIKELNRTGALANLRLYGTLAKSDDSSTTTEDPIKPHHRVSPLWVPKKWKKQLGDSKPSYHKRRSPIVTTAPLPVINRHSRVMQTPEEGEAISTSFAKDPPRSEIVMRVIQPNSGEQQAPLAREMHPGAFVLSPAGSVLTRSNDPSNPNGDAVKTRRERRCKHRPCIRNRHAANVEFDQESVGPRRLAAHFAANSTMYIMGHPHFAGNGRLRHPGVFSDWSPSAWMRELGMDNHFVLREGVLTVRQPGLYFFYSQIYYIDDHDNNGYNVYVNDVVRLQCTTMTHSSSAVTKINTCYTGGVMFLRSGDTVYLRDIAGLRYSLFEPDKSFFGLFRLSDARQR